MLSRNRRRPEGPNYDPDYNRDFGGISRSSGAYDSPDMGGYTGMGRYQHMQGSDSDYGTTDFYNEQEYSYRQPRYRSERGYGDREQSMRRGGGSHYDEYDEYGDTAGGWRGYESSGNWRGGRAYEEDMNPDRRYQASRGFSRGGYETGYGERGMKGSTRSDYRQGDYGSGSYRGFNEYDRRDNRGGYGTQDNDYDNWNLGNYGSRGRSERDHYGFDDRRHGREWGYGNR